MLGFFNIYKAYICSKRTWKTHIIRWIVFHMKDPANTLRFDASQEFADPGPAIEKSIPVCI